MAHRYRYRFGENTSRSMTHQAAIDQLIREQISSEGEIQRVGEDWPDRPSRFKIILIPITKIMHSLKLKEAHRRAESTEQKNSDKWDVIGSLLVLGLSYLALKSEFFNVDLILRKHAVGSEPVPARPSKA